MTHPILTASIGKNTAQLQNILSLYVPLHSTIADLTYGKGWFWKNIDCSLYTVFGSDVSDRITQKQPPLSFIPTPSLVRSDATLTPYRSESLDAVIVDPPYANGSTTPRRDSISAGYNLGSLVGLPAIMEFYKKTALEIARILKPSGIAIIKCQDMVNSGKNHFIHCDIKTMYENLPNPCTPIDLLILVQKHTPIVQHARQFHARKNHSYWWVFKKRPVKHVKNRLTA
jgi:methylase of polypeptide subunit release factors